MVRPLSDTSSTLVWRRWLWLCCASWVTACASDAAPRRDGAAAASEDGGGDTDGGMRELEAGQGTTAQCRSYDVQRQPFFGDLHVHTALSLDANLQGTRLRPSDAYRFARGERVGLPPYDAADEPMRTLQLSRPLDFAAVTDHAEFLGLVTSCVTPGVDGYDSSTCSGYRDSPALSFIALNAGLGVQPADARYVGPCTADNEYCGSAAVTAWNEIRSAAEAAQDRSDACSFTSLIGYEWSGSPATRNLHRNVIFRNDQVPSLPFGYFDGSRVEDLWAALRTDCLEAGTGCDVLTIPHNSNLSAGLMFEALDKDGKPFDEAYAKERAQMEPLVEIFQHKGSSECMPEMGPDEQCEFELMPYNTLASVTIGAFTDALVPQDYVRDALGRGLKLQRDLGHNPFAYGFIGSSDSHMGTAGGVEEDTFAGHGGAGSNARDVLPAGLADNVWLNPGGLAVLWAEENSREALFAAMRRREAYATSGPRILLRMFGGYDLDPASCEAADFVEQGYGRGVPMGGELPAASGKKPRFAVWASKDPGTEAQPGVDLERIQIIKGYLEGGQVRYAILDVASSGEQASVGDDCSLEGRGKTQLCAVYTDEDFDPAQQAFYYARVLENPSCRWHARVCRARGVDCSNPLSVGEGLSGCCAGYPEVQQERAWSSPIFYRAPP